MTELGHGLGTWPRPYSDTCPWLWNDQWVPWPGRVHWWRSSGKDQKQAPSLNSFQGRWEWSLLLRLQQLRVWFTKPSGFQFFWFWFWFWFLFENKNKVIVHILPLCPEDLIRCQQGFSVWRTNHEQPLMDALFPHTALAQGGAVWGCTQFLNSWLLWDDEGSTGFPELRGNPTCNQMFKLLIRAPGSRREKSTPKVAFSVYTFHALALTKYFCW